MSTPQKTTADDATAFMDMTIFNTPLPQASSTVRRQNALENMYARRDFKEIRQKSPSNKDDNLYRSHDSSLGILNNISLLLGDASQVNREQKQEQESTERKKEFARMLVQRCSDFKPSSPCNNDINKENNANMQNLTNYLCSNNSDLSQATNMKEYKNEIQTSTHMTFGKTSSASVVFEPKEITARSSEMNESIEKNQTSLSCGSPVGGISFNTTVAELMARFNDEEFHSASQMANQISADEAAWQQNCSYAFPVSGNTEKERLNLSCFSGIIGELDLSIESSVSRRVSVGEFFKRKCGNIGDLSEETQKAARPSFGLNTKSPKKKEKLVALVDSTVSDVSSAVLKEKEQSIFDNMTKNVEEQSIMSLSSIAQALQDMDDCTPRKLVDQLIMAKKMKKYAGNKLEDYGQNTYTILPSDRNSMPSISYLTNNDRLKENTKESNLTKLSLDSKMIHENSLGAKPKMRKTLSFSSDSIKSNLNNVSTKNILKEEEKSTSIPNWQQGIEQVSKEKRLKNAISKEELSTACWKTEFNEETKKLEGQKLFKEENISYTSEIFERPTLRDQSQTNENIIVKKNGQEICSCIVGIYRKTSIELQNISDRWMICSLDVLQLQGDKHNVEIKLPTDPILTKPNSTQAVKIGIKVAKKCEPIVIVLQITAIDMVTRLESHIKHVLYIEVEDLQITITTPFRKDELDFQNIEENSVASLPITIRNNNSISVTLKVMLPQNGQKIFSINTSQDEWKYTLKPQENVTINIQCQGSSYLLEPEGKRLSRKEAKLFVQVEDKGDVKTIKEIALLAYVGSNKIRDIDVNATSPTSPHSIVSARSRTSGRNSPSSSVSGSTVAGDKIPIKATHTALTWNSVRTGKSDAKEFTIRNISDNKIKIQALISDDNKNFKFPLSRERQPACSSIVLVLHSMESRTLSVVFCPHRVGAATGKIIFKHYEPHRKDNVSSRPSKAIYLCGYGGCGKVDISETFKDTSGKMWISLGRLNDGESLAAKIKLQNNGDISAYAKVKLTPKAVYPSVGSSWHVSPTEILLEPRKTEWVTLEFHPRKEDLAILKKSDVSHVGTLNITHGDEPTRWRIRRLYNKLKKTSELGGNESEHFRDIVYPICRPFPGEQLIPDLCTINDTLQNLGDLCRGVRQYEIMLTMECSADETIIHDNADESQMFYSLCNDNSHISEVVAESFLLSDTVTGRGSDILHRRTPDDYFTVTPSVISLILPMTNEASVMILSSSKVAQPFETVISHADVLSVVPGEGMIPAGKGFALKIRCSQRAQRNFEAQLEIYTENHKQDVMIKVAVRR